MEQLIKQDNLMCRYCNKICKNKNSLAQHERMCKDNPQRAQSNFIEYNKTHDAWNKGLTKETDARVKKNAESYSNGVKNGTIIPSNLGKHLSDKTKEKLSTIMQNKIEIGEIKVISHSKAKHGYYNGIWCDSSWELAYVIYNLEHNIIFERNHDHFEYFYNDKKYLYFPDFKLEDGTYIEIKGYADKKFVEKEKQFPKDKKLIVLYKEQLKDILSYVINKYGEYFWNLYSK